MFKNENFNTALERSGLTMYAVSKYTGVPYTTINEIRNGKIDINQCAAATVWRLAGVLDSRPEDIINAIDYLDGVKGRHKGIDYVWITDDTSRIAFEYQGEDVSISTGAVYNIPARLKYYNTIAGWLIDDYLARKRWEEESKTLIETRTER